MSLDNALEQVVTKLTDIVQAHGQEAVNLGGSVLQAKAGYDILWPIGATVATVIVSKFAFTASKQFLSKNSKNSYDDDPTGWFLASLGLWILVFGFGSASLIGLFSYTLNPVYWLAVFSPYYALAATVLGLL